MSSWIDADALPRHGQRGGLVHWKDIADAPSIDIVRCKECKWRNHIGCALMIVDDSDKPKDDDFCSYGQRGNEDVETD